MSDFDNDNDLFGKPEEQTEDFIDELDSLKDILDGDFESGLPDTEEELEKAIADALKNVTNEVIPVVPTEESMPIAEEIEIPVEALVIKETPVAEDTLATVEEPAPEVTEKNEQLELPEDKHPPEEEVIPPLLNEVVFTSDQLPEVGQELLATTADVADSSAPVMEREELEILVETLIEREIPRFREELKDILMVEMERLFPRT